VARHTREQAQPVRWWETHLATFVLLFRDWLPELVHDADRAADTCSWARSRCSAHNRTLVARASSASQVTTFISVSLKSECSLRFAEPSVSQRSSTIAIFAWT